MNELESRQARERKFISYCEQRKGERVPNGYEGRIVFF